MPRRCFIAAPGDADLHPVIGVLEERGWETFALGDVANLGASLTDAMTDAVRSADMVVAILEDDAEAPGTIFEIGVATGMGKPVLIVTSGDARVPADLRGFVQVRSTPMDTEALRLALDNLERYESERKRQRPPRLSGKPLGSYSDVLLEEVGPDLTVGSELETLVVKAIEASGAIASRGAGPDSVFDIGVWSDDLDAIAGNPLLVELKGRIDGLSVRQSLLALHQVPGARAALILSLEDIDDIGERGLRWPVMGISLRQLLEEMRTQSFAEVVRELRNRSVHGQSV